MKPQVFVARRDDAVAMEALKIIEENGGNIRVLTALEFPRSDEIVLFSLGRGGSKAFREASCVRAAADALLRPEEYRLKQPYALAIPEWVVSTPFRAAVRKPKERKFSFKRRKVNFFEDAVLMLMRDYQSWRSNTRQVPWSHENNVSTTRDGALKYWLKKAQEAIND